MANLEITFGGLKMRNPIGIAALNPAIAYAREPKVQAEWLLRHVEAGAGYLYTSATRPQRSSPLEAKPSQKFMKIQCPGFASREGLHATGDIMAVQFYLDKTLETMALVKKELPKDVPLIAQPHLAVPDKKGWVELCKIMEQAGADALELNFCPLSLVGKEDKDSSSNLIEQVDTFEMKTLLEMGLAPSMGEIPEVLAVLVKACVEAVKIPVGLKPSAEAGFPKCVALAKIAADAGAKFIANVTAPMTIAPPDIYNQGRSPWERVYFPINPFAAICGPADRYQCRKTTVTVSMFVPQIDILAIGGIVNPEHSVEMMMLGARAIGLSSGFFWKGRKLIIDTINFLNKFMDEHGYDKVEDLVGLGLKYVKPVDDTIDWKMGEIAAKVDREKCIKCGVCYDSYCPVPVKDIDDYPVIDADKCQGCGMCAAICPSDAITVIKR